MAADAVEDVTETLRSRYDGLTSSQKRIAEAIVEDPEFVAFATVDKLSGHLGVASSTVVRFAYKLGLDGYQDLQDRVRAQVRRQYRHAEAANEAPAGHLGETALADSFARDLRHLQRTVRALDRETLERAVEQLATANRVFICGDLTAYSLAHFSAIAVGRAREDVRLVKADAEGVTALLGVGEGDLLLAFTFPPYSRGVLRVVDWAKQRDATTIGVTDAGFSPVGQRVDTVLSVVASGLGPQNTLVPAFGLVNALVNGVILRMGDQALERYRAVAQLASDWDLFVLGTDDGS